MNQYHAGYEKGREDALRDAKMVCDNIADGCLQAAEFAGAKAVAAAETAFLCGKSIIVLCKKNVGAA